MLDFEKFSTSKLAQKYEEILIKCERLSPKCTHLNILKSDLIFWVNFVT